MHVNLYLVLTKSRRRQREEHEKKEKNDNHAQEEHDLWSDLFISRAVISIVAGEPCLNVLNPSICRCVRYGAGG